MVLAAASLTDAFGAIARDYEAETGTPVLLSFAGSQLLATQLEAGIEADVIAVANAESMTRLQARGLVAEPVVFASNHLVWVTRRGAPVAFDRLADPELRLVLAAPEVPAGGYSRQALERLGVLEQAEARLVSQELDVKGVVSKLMLGGADAGMTYTTDISPREREVLEARPLPESADVRAYYFVAVARPSARAEAFVAMLLESRGRAHLSAQGFEAP